MLVIQVSRLSRKLPPPRTVTRVMTPQTPETMRKSRKIQSIKHQRNYKNVQLYIFILILFTRNVAKNLEANIILSWIRQLFVNNIFVLYIEKCILTQNIFETFRFSDNNIYCKTTCHWFLNVRLCVTRIDKKLTDAWRCRTSSPSS